jgi:serine/threonine protein phosphatase 1
MQKHYIIGDVHGEYHTLLALVEKLPRDAKLIFVGDLIDRGRHSREVIDYIRTNNHQTVMGNHEVLFCKYGLKFLSYLDGDIEYEEINQRWHKSGRFETFLSYGVVEVSKSGKFSIVNDSKRNEIMRDDIEWMRRNPIYIQLDATHSSDKKVVISHSNLSKVWNIRNDKERSFEFKEVALWTRDDEIDKGANIFNIFGHSPRKYHPEIGESYANIDTGCCFDFIKGNLYGRLSAYCVESGEVVIQKKLKRTGLFTNIQIKNNINHKTNLIKKNP